MKIYEPNVSIFNFIAPKSIVQKCPPLENVTKKFMKFRKKKNCDGKVWQSNDKITQ